MVRDHVQACNQLKSNDYRTSRFGLKVVRSYEDLKFALPILGPNTRAVSTKVHIHLWTGCSCWPFVLEKCLASQVILASLLGRANSIFTMPLKAQNIFLLFFVYSLFCLLFSCSTPFRYIAQWTLKAKKLKHFYM